MRIIKIIVFLLAVVTSTAAQNKIDRMVDKYSTVGQSEFTSAVERDPKTRKVVKVVNVLKIPSFCADEFVRAFESEGKRSKLITTVRDNTTSLIITAETPTTNRIYMMEYSGNTPMPKHPIITIIVKYKVN